MSEQTKSDQIIEILKGQIKSKLAFEELTVRARLWELELLLPAVQEIIPPVHNFDNIFVRQLADYLREADNTKTFHFELLDLYETHKDEFDIKELDHFCRSTEVAAAINMTTETWEDYERKLNESNSCENCRRGYSLQGLSVAAFTEGLEEHTVMGLSHADDDYKAYGDLYMKLLKLVGSLVPTTP